MSNELRVELGKRREVILDAIRGERERQVVRWKHDDDHSLWEWVAIVVQQLGDCLDASERGDEGRAYIEGVQAAAVIVAMLENYMPVGIA